MLQGENGAGVVEVGLVGGGGGSNNSGRSTHYAQRWLEMSIQPALRPFARG